MTTSCASRPLKANLDLPRLETSRWSRKTRIEFSSRPLWAKTLAPLPLSVLLREMGHHRLPAPRMQGGRRQQALGEPSPPDPGSCPRPPAPSPGARAGQVLAPPVRVLERLTARTRAGNDRAQRGSELLGARRSLFGTAVRTGVGRGHRTVPRPPPERRSQLRRGRGSELAALPPVAGMVCPGHPDWFLASVRTPRRPGCQATA